MVDVLYEDNHILVCVKPQNIPSQQDSSNDLDMLNIIKKYIKEKYHKQGNVYVGLVHRLDRPTGGVMVFAKTSKSAKRLSEQIKTKDFEKNYYAVLCGVPTNTSSTLVHYLKKDEKQNKVYVTKKQDANSKRAELDYEVKEIYHNKLSLVDVKLKTGRSHQIRVQMSSIKTPIFGDSKYGTNLDGDNLALWAYKLSFVHPTTKQRLNFVAFPPISNLPWKYFETLKINKGN